MSLSRGETLTGNDIKARLRSSALRTGKLARGTSHVLIAQMAAKPIPIEQSCLTVSEPMLSSRDFVQGRL